MLCTHVFPTRSHFASKPSLVPEARSAPSTTRNTGSRESQSPGEWRVDVLHSTNAPMQGLPQPAEAQEHAVVDRSGRTASPETHYSASPAPRAEGANMWWHGITDRSAAQREPQGAGKRAPQTPQLENSPTASRTRSRPRFALKGQTPSRASGRALTPSGRRRRGTQPAASAQRRAWRGARAESAGGPAAPQVGRTAVDRRDAVRALPRWRIGSRAEVSYAPVELSEHENTQYPPAHLTTVVDNSQQLK